MAILELNPRALLTSPNIAQHSLVQLYKYEAKLKHKLKQRTMLNVYTRMSAAIRR